MAFFKRVEVWFLLILSIGIAGWVIWSERTPPDGDEDSPEGAAASEVPAPPARFAIAERRLRAEGEHGILTVRVERSGGAGGEPVDLGEPAARLVTGSGEAVPRFFLPFDPPPLLDGGAGAAVELRFWIPLPQVARDLWLEIGGDRLAVKDPSPPDDAGWASGPAPAGGEREWVFEGTRWGR